MDLQETFDQVVSFAFKQNAKSEDTNNDMCMYRDGNGNSCFVGAFIPDKEYSEQMEGKDVEGLLQLYSCIKYLKIDGMNKYQSKIFWQKMQDIHDDSDITDWPLAFNVFAHENNLKAK